MLSKVILAFKYLVYLISSGTKHSVHSPFVYDFIINVMEKSRNDPQKYHGVEFLRHKMLKSKAQIKIQDFGAKKKGEYEIKLSKMVQNTAKMAKYARLLHQTCLYYKPTVALEIGTNVGISSMYQALAIPEGYLFTLEGSPSCAEIASYNLQRLGLQNTQIVVGDFKDTLPKVLAQLPKLDYVFFDGNHSMEATLDYFNQCKKLAHNDTIFIFDDINWNDDMQECWQIIKLDKDVKITLDIFFMGIVFFRGENTEKEDFTIRY